MKTLEELYAEIKNLNEKEKEKLLEEKANGLTSTLSEFTDKNINGYNLLYSFVLGAIEADGKLTKEELHMSKPFFKAFFHEKVDEEEIKKIYEEDKGNNDDSNSYLANTLSLLASIDYTAKEDILSICLIILSSDELTESEKNWLKQIY